jgi:hypothetical protein
VSKIRSIPLIVWILVGLALVALPLRILSYGYLPSDDALRHAAKAVSGKPWSEIIVLRPEITIDHNPGWHLILGFLHRLTGWNPRMLVQFSVVAMFILFAAAPLPWLRRPEAWLASLAIMTLSFPYLADRAFLGRPLFITIAVTLILLSAWTRARVPISRGLLLWSTLLIALSTWIHGSWYLLVLIPIVFALAQQWRKAILLGACWAAGSIFGALLTGHPIAFLTQSALIPFWALGRNAPPEALVGEFQPLREGYIPALIIAGAVLMWRTYKGRRLADLWRDPVFLLAVLGLLLGFRIVRFWLDWGIPAFALWLAREIEQLADLKTESWSRIAVSAAAAAALFLGIGSDRGARWSQYAKLECLDASRPGHAQWVPEPGGILYSVDLSVFYETFFTNPHGNWRYIMGFEPTFMRPEDLTVYHDICRTHNAIRACAPWVKKMTPADRLVLHGPPHIRPTIHELEWFYAAQNTWVGRRSR